MPEKGSTERDKKMRADVHSFFLLFFFFCSSYLTTVRTCGHVRPISARQSPKMEGVVGLLLVRTEKDRGPYRLRTLEQAANNLISRKDLRASLNRNSWEENVARAREREGVRRADRYVISLLDYNWAGWRPSLWAKSNWIKLTSRMETSGRQRTHYCLR